MRMPACACDGRSNECARVHAMTRSFSAGFLFRIYSRRDRGCRDCRAELNKVHLAQNIIHPSRLESIPGRVATSSLVTRVRELARARHALHGSRRDIVQFREGEREREEILLNKNGSSRVTRGAGSFGRSAKILDRVNLKFGRNFNRNDERNNVETFPFSFIFYFYF